jgi:hypothetical protein
VGPAIRGNGVGASVIVVTAKPSRFRRFALVEVTLGIFFFLKGLYSVIEAPNQLSSAVLILILGMFITAIGIINYRGFLR